MQAKELSTQRANAPDQRYFKTLVAHSQQRCQECQQRMKDLCYRHLNFASRLFFWEQKYRKLQERYDELMALAKPDSVTELPNRRALLTQLDQELEWAQHYERSCSSATDHAMYGAKHFGRNQVRTSHDPVVLALFSKNNAQEGREEAALVGVVEALVTLVKARDSSTGHHSQQVADLVLQLASVLGLPSAEAQMIALASRLHDVGKVAVPDSVLLKPSVLTEEEWRLMRMHPVVGADVVSHIPVLRPLAPVIRAHHERWDGQGYPDHLKGEAIPLGARILSVVDTYLAMIVNRPYQKARAPAAALAELCRCAGSQFDPHVVEVMTFLL